MTSLTPREADRVEIVTVVDNLSDLLLPSGPNVERAPRGPKGIVSTNTLLAEHGLCLLIKVYQGDQIRNILLDAGYTSVAAPHNLEFLGLKLDNLDAVVLSHGHMDHTGGLVKLLGAIDDPVPVIAHPDAFAGSRYSVTPAGARNLLPIQAAPDEIKAAGGELRLNAGPELIAGDSVLVSGTVEKTTDFEKGMPNAMVERDGELVQDPIDDDQFLVMRLKDHGLVVVSGCAHSGIVNSVRYAQKLTGIDQVYAVAGGFHLGGPLFEPIIDQTVQELKALKPQIVVPMHCTGFNAQKRFAQEFGSGFILNSVGSKITVGEAG